MILRRIVRPGSRGLVGRLALVALQSMWGEPVIETPRMSLWYLPEDGIVYHQMHQYPGQHNLQQVLLRGLAVLKEHGASKWLSDNRAGGALPKSHHDWGDQIWAPQAIAAGWRYWALLPPDQALGQTNMSRLLDAYARHGVVTEAFRDPTLALAWLRRQGDPKSEVARARSSPPQVASSSAAPRSVRRSHTG